METVGRVTASDRKWPQVTASDRKWPQVTASDRKWPQVTASDRWASDRRWLRAVLQSYSSF